MMLKEEMMSFLKIGRRDVGSFLFHFTKTQTADKVLLTADSILEKILVDEKIIAGTGFIRAGIPCVCFTESPIAELASTFIRFGMEEGVSKRYEPYGIAVTKEWLFSKGGRPVIYQKADEYKWLPPTLQYRHVAYEPPKTDFTWEREWRVNTSELDLKSCDFFVVVPTATVAQKVLASFWDLESKSFDAEGSGKESFPSFRHRVISLDLFGLDWPDDDDAFQPFTI